MSYQRSAFSVQLRKLRLKLDARPASPAGRRWQLEARLGFSLIEILVAATLIGLLSTIGFTGFQAVTRSGRDALRKSDLEQIRSALEIYKSENGAYPANSSTCQSDELTSDYINPYPDDPKPPFSYCYVRGASALSYDLCAHLENGSTTDQFCGAVDSCTSNCNYVVTNP